MFLYFHSFKASLPPGLLRSRVCVYCGFNPAWWSRSSLAFTVLLGGSAGGVVDDVREARPPDLGRASGDDEQALQGCGVVGRVGAARASFWDVVDDGDAGTGTGVGVGAAPGVLPESQRASDWPVYLLGADGPAYVCSSAVARWLRLVQAPLVHGGPEQALLSRVGVDVLP